MKHLIDSDWLIDCLYGNQHAIAELVGLAPEGLAVSIISVAEIDEGAYGQADSERHLQSFRAFLRAFTVLPIDESIADRFARLRSTLRQEGRLIADFDLLIAATALIHGLKLLTRNVRDFYRITGIELHKL